MSDRTRVENWSGVSFITRRAGGGVHMVDSDHSWFTYCGLPALTDERRAVSEATAEVCGNCARVAEMLERRAEVPA